MSRRGTLLGWLLVTTACLGLCVGLSIGGAEQRKTPAPETLLPAGSVIYIGYDGSAAHEKAYRKTAAHQALDESGLMDLFRKVIQEAGATMGGRDLQKLKQAGEHVSARGFSLGVAVSAKAGPPLPRITLVLHGAAKFQPGLTDLWQQATRGRVPLSEKIVQGRTVTRADLPIAPGAEIGWWSEGDHLVVVAGIDAVASAIDVAGGKSANITTSELWKTYRSGNAGFEVASLAWCDFRALRKTYGAMPVPMGRPGPPITVNALLEKLGLSNLGPLVYRYGYQGRAIVTETTIEAPGPRKGLLALVDRKPITLSDLPPLPSDASMFYAASVDMSRLYDTLTGLAGNIASLGSPADAQQVDSVVSNLKYILGFDPKQELLAPLGNVAAAYIDPAQGPFGLGVGLVVKVNDAKTLRATFDKIAATIKKSPASREISVLRTRKHGREIMTFKFPGGFVSPSLVVDDNWLAIGLYPQTVEAFLMRLDGKLPKWKPTADHREALAAMPSRFNSILVTDPRETYRMLIGAAPMLLGVMESAMNQGRPSDRRVLPISVADIPPAELVTRPLFPNVSVRTVDATAIHWRSRSSLPAVPLVGASSGATVPVLVALLLPAVQQARAAARRAQSKNNLKQLGLALHNYHDTYQSFPSGTHLNPKLKADKRLSWLADVLPYMDQRVLYRRIDFKKPWNDKKNAKWLKVTIRTFQNPGVSVAAVPKYGTTHYVGIAGRGKDAPTLAVTHRRAGMFGNDRLTRIRDITDGTSNTLMVSEASKNFGPWGQGGKSTIRAFTKKPYINGPDGIGGPYQGGCNMGLADGSVRFLSKNIDPKILEALSTINGGEIINRNKL